MLLHKLAPAGDKLAPAGDTLAPAGDKLAPAGACVDSACLLEPAPVLDKLTNSSLDAPELGHYQALLIAF